MLAALQLSNLLYVVAAIVVATLISALIALRHRRPKSLESGIESFSRELRALAPERDGQERQVAPRPAGVAVRPGRPQRAASRRDGSRRPQGEHYRRPVDEVRASPATPGSPESTGSKSPTESTGTEGQAG
jgi:hypothetical protein